MNTAKRCCFIVLDKEQTSYFEEFFVANGTYWFYKPLREIENDYPYIKFVTDNYEQTLRALREKEQGNFYWFAGKSTQKYVSLVNKIQNWVYTKKSDLDELNSKFKIVTGLPLFE